MALILLRHPRPAIAEGTCYGRTDLPCADDPRHAAASASATLPPFDRIVTSPLARCSAVAKALSDLRSVSVHVDARFAELDFGTWEGRLWAKIDRVEIDAWAADFHQARPHGGESVAALATRVEVALREWGRLPGTTLVMTHLGVIRAALALRDGEGGWQAQVGFGGSVVLGEVQR